MLKRVLIYGLGKKFDEKKQDLKSQFTVVGYSDKNINLAEKLEQGEAFIPLEDFLSYDFHKIIVCGGGLEAKRYIFYRYMDDIAWEDIVLLDELEKVRISKADFIRDINKYEETNQHLNFRLRKEMIYPVTQDIGENADSLDTHYFMQDICVARKILEDKPERHYDIGSRIDGFIAHLLVFRKNITLIDVRPFPYQIDGMDFVQSDAVDLSGIQDESIESLSCLHAAEHFGLGRYGDHVDAEAFFKAMKNFERVLKKGGKLYLSVPCGSEDVVYFNAHRMFHPITILHSFTDLHLKEFEIIKDYQIKKLDIADTVALGKLGNYYCGIFTLEK